MRVILVGSPADRARLRAQLSATAVEVVAEFSTLAEARAATGRAIDRADATNGIDGILLAPERTADGDMGNDRRVVTGDERQVVMGNDRPVVAGNERRSGMGNERRSGMGNERELVMDKEREFVTDNDREVVDMDNDRDVVVGNDPLTPREIQVIELLAEGLSNKTIAARLGISDQTVKFHVASISGKLGAANRTDAVRRAVRRGLITL